MTPLGLLLHTLYIIFKGKGNVCPLVAYTGHRSSL